MRSSGLKSYERYEKLAVRSVFCFIIYALKRSFPYKFLVDHIPFQTAKHTEVVSLSTSFLFRFRVFMTD